MNQPWISGRCRVSRHVAPKNGSASSASATCAIVQWLVRPARSSPSTSARFAISEKRVHDAIRSRICERLTGVVNTARAMAMAIGR
ncbi:MAG TPA: hypothetical protein VIP05_05090 [Burkholderiaceae bacterium]